MDAQTNIRRAVQDDAESIAGLVAEAYSSYIPRIGKKPGPMLDDYREVVADFSVFVLAKDAEIMGVLVLKVQKPALLLENIAVLPRHKGQGIGKALMAFSEDYGRQAGCEAIELYTHQLMTENIALYKGLGYQETRRATENGFARVFMRKPIAAGSA
ncbi:GNAT family N-acetyltransferase [Pseudomonas gingeri]|uniref:GNAT family N-acetyltransferase n=1 Tax=Pseudomonas gingeri TaxID=117681 RepID=UPI0015A3512C|nr:GNAT family N-acetyltransferase [Pseudomonas gingeri]NWD77939.1 GNAT family N-acetyltransferase [Pseudomonas gingeri]